MERFRNLVGAKLGRCSKCMRWSGRGTLASWALFGVTYLVWPDPLVLIAIAVVAGGFSVLLLAHAVRFGARFATAVADHLDEIDEFSEGGLDRRRFLGVAARGGVAGLTLSLFGRIPAAIAQETCAGDHPQSLSFLATSPSDCRAQARDQLQLGSCDALCAVQSATCTPPLTCVSERGPGRITDIAFDPGSGNCTASVICFCACGTA